MNADKVKGQMQALAYGGAMAAAARDIQKELLAEEAAAAARPAHAAVALDDLLDDPDLERLHVERLAALVEARRAAAEARRAAAERPGAGALRELSEGEFLEAAAGAGRLVAHFFHGGFARCAVLDRHLAALAPRHPGTRFVRVSAPDAPFFTEKLKIRMLPALLVFRDGVAAAERLVGFEALGGKDDFETPRLEAWLRAAGAFAPPPPRREGSSSDEEGDGGGGAAARRRQKGALRKGGAPAPRRAPDDESSDFDE